MACTICFESFTIQKRKRVGCPFCNEAACRECVETYLLTNTAPEPNCPSCRAAWSRDILNDTLSLKFLHGTFKDHRGKVLMDRERAKFPDTQEEAALYKNAREQLNRLYAKYEHKNRFRGPIQDQTWTPEEYQEYQTALTLYSNLVRNFGRTTTNSAPKVRKVFMQKCPATACEGFLSTQWNCGLCNGHFCKDCHEPKKESHTCKPDLVESIKAIKKEAKPCPKCAAQISKVDGCDQMFCTQCHTAFSWNSGQIETSHIHNPHYYQWVREQGLTLARAPGDGPVQEPCGGVPALTARIATVPPTPVIHYKGTMTDLLLEYLQHIQTMRQYSIVQCRHHIEHYNEEWYRVNRVQRMVNEITEDKWKERLEKAEKDRLRYRACLQLHEMYVGAGMDILGQCLNDDYDPVVIHRHLRSLDDFAEAANKRIIRAYKGGCGRLLLKNVPRNAVSVA